MENEIRFLKLKDPHGHMSNFYPSAISYMGKTYSTSEHLYQAQKFSHNLDYYEKIRTAHSPWLAAKLGRSKDFLTVPNWEAIRDDVMRVVVYLKYTQNLKIQAELLATGKAKLVEYFPGDNYWSGYGNGKNVLGSILMEIRYLLAHKNEIEHSNYILEVAQNCGMFQ